MVSRRQHRDNRTAGRIVFVLLLCVLLGACSAAPGIETGEETEESGYELLKAGSYKEAAQALEAEIAGGAGSEENWRYLGIARMGAGDYEGAAEAFETALEEAGILPGETEYDINYYLGSCYFKLGRYEDALEVYDAIIALRPGDADALQLRGTVRLQLGDMEGMLEDYDRVIALDGSDYDRLLSIVEVLSDNGYEAEGQQYLTEAIESGGDGMSSYDLGRLSYYAGDYETARVALEQIQSGSDSAVVLMLGRTYEALGDYNYASNVYRTALASDESNAEVYNQLGLCCMKMSDYESALEAFESGIAAGDTEFLQGLLFNRIIACEYLGDFAQAREWMEAYVEAYPGDEKAAREYTFLSTR